MVSVRKRSQEDLTVARRLGEEFALGDVRGVTRSRAERPFRPRLLAVGNAMCIAGAFGLLLFMVLLIIGGFIWNSLTSSFAGTVIFLVLMGISGVVGVGYFAGGIMANHAMAPGTDAVRTFWFDGGLARLATADQQTCVLRWDEVDTVTATIVSDNDGGWYYTCALHGRTGTAITLACDDDGTVGYAPALACSLLSEAARLLAPRFVPPLIEAYEAGQPVSIGCWTLDRTGISGSGSGYATDSCPWTGITRISLLRQPGKGGPATLITVSRDGRRPDLEIDLSEIPNGIFFPGLVAHAATCNGADVRAGTA